MTPFRRQALLSALFFLAVFALYTHGVSPAFHPDDSAETITAGATLSIQHPPGYPLHSVLGRLAVVFLPGSPAFSVNLLSAFFGAWAALALAWCLSYVRAELNEKPPQLASVDIAAALIAALGYQMWFQASIAKGGLYTLNLALSFALLLSVLCFRVRAAQGRPAAACMALMGLFFGLGLANHWTSQVVLVPALLVLTLPLLLAKTQKKEKLFGAALAGLFVLLGFSLYLYLPLRSALDPPLVWGDASSLKGFWWIFNRSQYAGLEADKTLKVFIWLLSRIGLNLRADLGWAGLFLLGAGWLWMFWRRASLAAGLFLFPLVLALAVSAKANPPADAVWIIDPYLLPVHAGVILGAAGLASLLGAFQTRGTNLLVTVFFLAGAITLGGLNAGRASQRNHFMAWDYIQNINLSSPRNAIVFCEGDSNTAGPFATHFAMGQRKDLAYMATVISDYPWYRKALAVNEPTVVWPDQSYGPAGNMAWIAAKNPQRPIVITNSYTAAWQNPAALLPRGLVMLKQTPAADGVPWSEARLDQNRVHPAFAMRGVFNKALPRDPLTDRLVTDNYVETRAVLAQAYMKTKAWSKAEREYLEIAPMRPQSSAPWVQAGNAAYFAGRKAAAYSYWKKAYRIEPENALVLSNLALSHFERGQWKQAESFAVKALEKDPTLANAIELRDKARIQARGGKSALVNQAAVVATQADKLGGQGKYAQALAKYLQAEKLGLRNGNLYRNMSAMHAQLKDFSKALQRIDQALNFNPKSGDYHKLRGIYLSNLGRVPEALRALKAAALLSPSDASIPMMTQKLEQALNP